MKFDLTTLDYEKFEFLCEDLLKALGLEITSRPARGPDGGKDIIAERNHTHDILGVVERERYLIQCKHTAGKNSVTPREVEGYTEDLRRHKANCYLLITNRTVSQTVAERIEALNRDTSDCRKAAFWNWSNLSELIQNYPDIATKYFISWFDEAKEAADYASNHHFSAHRGAILWMPGVTAIFGNDGYMPRSDDIDESIFTTRREVEQLRHKLSVMKVEELAFNTSEDDGYSWAILVASENAKELHDLIWDCYSQNENDNAFQRDISFERLNSYWVNFHKVGWKN